MKEEGKGREGREGLSVRMVGGWKEIFEDLEGGGWDGAWG